MNRRIKEGAAVVYFSSAWQAIEERNSSNVAQMQYTWSAAYIDGMIARDRDTDNNGSLDQRVYVMQDANWNITAIANSTGAVVERFQYDAYGSERSYHRRLLPRRIPLYLTMWQKTKVAGVIVLNNIAIPMLPERRLRIRCFVNTMGWGN